MYEKLTEKFLSMKWDQNCLNLLNTLISEHPITEDNVVSILDNVFPDWTFKITLMNANGERIAGTLFLPGRCYDGTGSNEWSAICNIINKLTANVNPITNPKPSIQSEASEAPKTTTASVMAQLSSIKANTAQNVSEAPKNDAQAIFDELMNTDGSTPQPTQKTDAEIFKQDGPEYVDFDSPEAEKIAQDFMKQIQKSKEDALKTPTAEEVNPNHVIMSQAWTTETGNLLKTWCQKHNVTSKEQMSAWFKRYCGLDYDYFNPEWTGRFINWTEALREQQTY